MITTDNDIQLVHNHTTADRYQCQECNARFSRLDSLTRHMKTCMSRNKKLKEYDDQIKVLTSENNHYKREIEYYKMLLDNAGGMLKSSISSLSYIIGNYKNAPPIEYIKINKILNKDIIDNNKLILKLIYHSKHRSVHEYLGDFIIEVYKKMDPEKQSLWNTDYTRLNYIVREIINKDTSDWSVDKKGVKTNKYIIEPLLDYIKPILIKYQKKKGRTINKVDDQCEYIADSMRLIAEIIDGIDDGTLAINILKYIAPHFYMDNKILGKDLDIKLLTDE